MNKLLLSFIYLASQLLLFTVVVHFFWTFSEIHAIILVLGFIFERYSITILKEIHRKEIENGSGNIEK